MPYAFIIEDCDIIDKAGLALYRAKRSGRGNAELAIPQMLPPRYAA